MSDSVEQADPEGADEAVKRPGFLAVICLIWASATPLVIMMYIRTPPPPEFPAFFTIAAVTLEAAKFIGLLGVWWMRKWGVYAYCAGTFILLGLLLFVGADLQSVVRSTGFALVNCAIFSVFIKIMR
jgi:hypothetical protein